MRNRIKIFTHNTFRDGVRGVLAFAACVLFSTPVPAQEPAAGGAQPAPAVTSPDTGVRAAPATADNVRQYLVELIILKNETSQNYDAEIWDRFSAFPGNQEPLPAAGIADQPGASVDPQPYAALPPEVEPAQLEHLADSFRILQADPQYRVLQHAAWLQPITGKKAAAVIHISRLPGAALATGPDQPVIDAPGAGPAAAGTSQLSGTIRIYENRLLFVEVDLAYRDPYGAAQADPAGRYGYGAGVAPHPMTYRINEKRRVKLNELHYLDHPLFGALIRVSRAEEAAASGSAAQ